MAKQIVIELPNKRRQPKKLAGRIDTLYQMREDRMAVQRQIKEAEKAVTALKEAEEEVARELAATLRKEHGGLQRASGELATFSPGSLDIFAVEDWGQFYSYIVQNDAFELLERRPSRAALKERIIDGEGEVPGVKADKKFTFSLTKASKS